MHDRASSDTTPIDVPSSPRLLAVRLDNIGDVVLLGPALRSLRAAYPRAHITLLASPGGAQVAPLLPWVDEVMAERTVWQDAAGAMQHDPAREQALVARLATGRFDAALIFTSWAQSPWPPAYACYLAGIPVRVGESKEFGGSLLTTVAEQLPDDAHQADRNLHLLHAAGIPAAGQHLELTVPPHAHAAAAQLLEGVGVDPGAAFIAVAPSASCATRRYHVDRFAVAVTELATRTGLPAVVLGSERDVERMSAITSVPGAVSLLGRTSVPELAAVLTCATALLASHSGPMHLADALGVPMVVLYSGSELESQWAPRGAPARLLGRPTACTPCHRFDCPYGLECLDVPPEEVVEELLDLISENLDREDRCARSAS